MHITSLSLARPVVDQPKGVPVVHRVDGWLEGGASQDLDAAFFGVPFSKALEFPGSPILARKLVQIGMSEICNSPLVPCWC